MNEILIVLENSLQIATRGYCKLRQLTLLQIATRGFYKLRQVSYYKLRQVLLKIETGITNCDVIRNCDSTKFF